MRSTGRGSRLSFCILLAAGSLLAGCQQDQELTRMQADVTEAASDLVQEDARARREILQMQAALDVERQRLHEQARQADKRARQAPLIAAAIQQIGGITLCLLPLLILLWLLAPRGSEQDTGELSQLMVDQLLLDDDAPLPPRQLEHHDLDSLVQERLHHRGD